MIKIFFARFFLFVAPVALLVAMVNYKIDPANIFSTNLYVKGIAEILSAGHNVDNISNYDERLLQEQMISRLTSSPDIIVVGSSRIMQVGNNFYPGKKVLNCGVSHANIKDVAAIIGLLDSLKKMPSEIVLNADPGLISKGGTNEWESLSVYYNYFLSKQAGISNNMESPAIYMFKKRFYSLFSPQYFQSSLLFLGKRRTKKYTDVGNNIPSLYGRINDGTVSYSYEYMHPDSAEMVAKAYDEGKAGHFDAIDTAHVQLLEKVLDYCAEKKVQVKMYMLPYHPAFYTATNKYHQQQFVLYTDYYKTLAAKRNLPLAGSFDPAVYNITGSCFYDDSHSSAESLKKIIKEQ